MSENKRSMNPLALVLLLSGAFFLVFLIVSGVFFFYSGSKSISKTGTTASFLSGGVVGVVEVNGIILDSKKTLSKLEKLEEDDRVKAVVIRLNSGGGAVAPSQEIYQAVKNFKKPIVASMGSVAASGAYYIACGAQKIFANPGTLTGSIGVIMEFANLQKLYEWAKIQRYAIKTGKFKSMGAEYREMTAEERELLQTMVNDVLDQFKIAVSEGRKLKLEQVTALADGRIFSGHQAKKEKLVDELGTLQDAIDEAGTLGKIKGKPHVVYLEKKKKSFLDFFIEDPSWEDRGSDSKTNIVNRVLNLADHVAGEGSALALEPGLYWLWR